MDRRRKCALTKLKTLLNLLNDEEYPTCGDTGNSGGFRAASREEYPTCPAMVRKRLQKTDDAPFESTLRKKIYPLVPYREKRQEQCFHVHECSPSTTLCLNSVTPEEPDIPNNFQIRMNQSSPFRNRRYPYSQKTSPKLYVIKQDSFPDNPLKNPRPLKPLFGRPLRRIQQNVIPPPKCCQSKELRGGFMHHGCDCDKTNGLQDRCLRFCCLRNPKCKTRPAACYLSRFSGGRHLPDITTQVRTAPAYVDFNEESDCGDFEYGENEDQEVVFPPYEDLRDSIACHNYERDYGCQEPQNMRCIPYQTDFHTPRDYSMQDGRAFPRCQREPRVLKIPHVLYESPDDSCRFEPTKVCVYCPLSYIESPNEVSDAW